MKRLTLLMAFALILAYGCQKQETISTAANQQTEESGTSVWVFNSNSDNPSWAVIQISELQGSSTSSTLKKGNSAHTHGDLTGYGGSTTITFSGTQNNGGSHGSAEIFQVSGPFTAHYILETASVYVDGNEAIYGGIINEVLENSFPPPPPPPPGAPPPACNPYDLGNYVYFKVIDNGQGNNAPLDQYFGIIFQSCSARSDDGANYPWVFSPYWGINDVQEGDKIKINN